MESNPQEFSSDDVTVLLNQAGDGDRTAKERLFGVVQKELRLIAERQMRRERAEHSLQATVLIDDAFLKLIGEDVEVSWENRRHFYCTAAKAMRRMLIDHERARRAQRRGGTDHQRVGVDPDHIADQDLLFDLLALDEALQKLAEFDPRQAEIVELHHFGGCSLKETAELLEVSVGTIKADWRMAKAWLHRELTRDAT